MIYLLKFDGVVVKMNCLKWSLVS